MGYFLTKHREDYTPCCDKARKAYQNPGANKKQVAKKWQKYFDDARPWSDCNAYTESVKCAEELYKEKKCPAMDCEENKCCGDILTYKNSMDSQKTSYCGKKGADKAPACPF